VVGTKLVIKFMLLICFFSAGGSLILTNIYLLVGVSLPLWIWPHPFTSRPSLPLYAGAEEIAAEHAYIKQTVKRTVS
jgi:hypothetical protein